MKSRYLLLLTLCCILIGCGKKSEKAPQYDSTPIKPATILEPPIQEKPKVETANKKSTKQVSFKKPNTNVKASVDYTLIKSKVFSILDSGQFDQEFEKLMVTLWPSLQKMEKRSLIDKILHTNTLSKSLMGRKPYQLTGVLIKLKLDTTSDLHILNALKNNQQPNLDAAKRYLRACYNKNYGSNFYEWKQEILKRN